VTRLPGQIEEIILLANQVSHAVTVSDISDVDAQSILNTVNIEKTAAILWDETVDQRNPRAAVNQTSREVRPDEAKASGDQYPFILKEDSVIHRLAALKSTTTRDMQLVVSAGRGV
jgi:hypothetical protein